MSTDNHADAIYYGGPIITMVDHRREVEAIAVADGRIIATGEKEYVFRTKTDKTRLVDLAGKTLLPAFIDSHGHFMNALQVAKWANVSSPPVGPVTDIPGIVAVLQAHVEQQGIKPGEWIIGYGYDRGGLVEGRELTRDDLDPHFPDNPVMLLHVSNHGAVLNSQGFAAFKVDANTPTPAGGVILRKEGSNEPAGLLMEMAFLPLFSNIPQPTEDELLATMDAAQQVYASSGVTTAQEGATHAKDLRLLRKAAEQGRFYLDVVSLPFLLEIPALVREYLPSYQGAETELPEQSAEAFGHYRNRLKLQGIKFMMDGSPQGKTAFWSEPLLTPGPGGEANWRGAPVLPPEIVFKAMAEVHAKDIQIFTHANGDAAIDMLIEGARQVGLKAGDDRRWVVIHSQCMRPDQIAAYAELGLSPTFFTLHTFFWGTVHTENLGEQRAGYLSPMCDAIDAGLVCSNHSDFSVCPLDPMRILWSSVTRQSREGQVIGPEQRIERWDGLKALTINAAWQLREEDSKGTLETSKLADLVILDGNPLAVETDAILTIKVVETIKEGQTIYPRPAQA